MDKSLHSNFTYDIILSKNSADIKAIIRARSEIEQNAIPLYRTTFALNRFNLRYDYRIPQLEFIN